MEFRLISGICDFVSMLVCVHAQKGKRLNLSIPNLVHTYCTTGTQHAVTLRSKGQGHKVMKCAASMGMHVDTTA